MQENEANTSGNNAAPLPGFEPKPAPAAVQPQASWEPAAPAPAVESAVAPPAAVPAPAPPRKKKGGGVMEFAVIIVVALILAWGITTFVAQPYEIPSGSMEETIQIGDRVISEKVSYYMGEPQVGDIVTFTDPEDASRTLIKRVVATAGQTVDLVDGVVYVDGVALKESSYTLGKPSYPLDSIVTIEYPYTVPQGCIWVMGDNRTNSSDSRYFGAVPVESVTGRAFFRYWPLSSIGLLD